MGAGWLLLDCARAGRLADTPSRAGPACVCVGGGVRANGGEAGTAGEERAESEELNVSK